jgi:hypothetical protein
VGYKLEENGEANEAKVAPPNCFKVEAIEESDVCID